MESRENELAVERMLRYIEMHISEPITLRMLADAAWYSPWHCARLFKESTGMAPFTYIRQKRLTLAARILREESRAIVDVAFDFVFDSHEGFTRAFSRQFGMSPSRFRLSGVPLPVFPPPQAYRCIRTRQIGETGMEKKKSLQAVFVQVVDRPARKVILKYAQHAADYFAYCGEVGCEVWDVLAGVKEALYEPIGMWMPLQMRKKGTSEYVQGVEVPVDFTGTVPEGFDIIDLPPCRMMVFQGPPFEEKDFEEAIEGLWDEMKVYDPKLYGFEWADGDGPRFQLAPMGYRGYIEARPVRKI
ncbi:MAG: helix-turn-helix transcriptional regulator [Sphaerochaetaceae bacterium]